MEKKPFYKTKKFSTGAVTILALVIDSYTGIGIGEAVATFLVDLATSK